jgi:hypothetical protein
VTHSEVRALLGDYLEGELQLAERGRIDAHLPECPRCSQELRELRATIGLLRGLDDPSPRSDLTAAVMQRIAAGEASAPVVLHAFRRIATPRIAAPLAAALAALAVFAGLQAVSPERSASSVGPLPNLPLQPPVRTTALLPNPSAFGPATPVASPADLEREIQRFLQDPAQNPDSLLDGFGRLELASRDRAISDFAARVRAQRHDAAVRERLVGSGHRMAPVVLVHFITSAAPAAPPSRALPVTLTSGESPR